MYAVVLSNKLRPQLHSIDGAHQFVLDTMLSGLRKLVPEVARRGTSDLAMGERKFSGNSLRCKRTHLLYHGTLLYDFPLELIAACLRTAPRQPEYRAGRAHREFVANLPTSGQALRDRISGAWRCQGQLDSWPVDRVSRLLSERYRQPAWHQQF
jgi:lipoate---protein ligase